MATQPPPSTFRLPPGTQLNGIYEIDEPIASGGMGDIYRGHAIETGDTVAIKVMRPELAENEAALALFRKEASALHNLYHEAIVRYFVFTVEPTLRRPYLAMEFVEGQPLSDMLRRGPLSFEAVWGLKQRIAEGLQKAHERGIVHRDVSPDNILVPMGDVGRAKIIDFGIARSLRPDSSATVIGSGFAGKFSYVSPEQLGMFGGEVTAKSDIYSLGLVLAESSRGRPIDMGGSQFDSIERRRTVPDLSGIEPRLRPLLELMLQPDPADRPASMAEVAAVPAGSPMRSKTRPPTQPPRREARAPRRAATGVTPIMQREPPPKRSGGGARIAVIATAALVLLGGAGGFVYFLALPSDATAPPAPKLEVKNATPSPPATNPRVNANKPEPPARPAGNPPIVNPPPSSQQQARLDKPPVEPPRTSAPPGTRAEQLARYINQYNGGDCFFVLPIALNEPKPKIDGFGTSTAPFEIFDTAFSRANNVEADIGVRTVTSAQCPALTFLNKVRSTAAAPKLEVGINALRNGEELSGTLDNVGTKQLAFLLVSDSGTVHNLTSLLLPDDNGIRRFKFPLRLSGAPGSQPQLLIALTSALPLEALRPAGTLEASQFFPPLMVEASGPGNSIGATAKYFRLER